MDKPKKSKKKNKSPYKKKTLTFAQRRLANIKAVSKAVGETPKQTANSVKRAKSKMKTTQILNKSEDGGIPSNVSSKAKRNRDSANMFHGKTVKRKKKK